MGWLPLAALAAVVVIAAVLGGGVILLLLLTRGADTLRGLAGVLPRLKAQVPRVYFGKKYLLSRGEAAFYRVLLQAAAPDYVVMAKVRLADVVDAKAEGRGDWLRAFNRISAKHVDFVLLDARDLTIRLVVELDDRSHARENRYERDGFVNDAMREAGVPVLHVKAAARYGVQELMGMIEGAQ